MTYAAPTRLVSMEDVVVLEQAAIWRSWGDHGRLMTQLVDDMTPQHRAHTLAWLRGHAEMLLNQRRDHITRLHKRGLLSDQEWGQALAALDATPAGVWLEEQPLVRRLVQLVGRPPALPRRGILRMFRR